MIPDWLALMVVLAAGGLLLFFSLVRIFEAPINDKAKAVWVLIVFLVPVLGVLLPFAVLPKGDEEADTERQDAVSDRPPS